MANKEWIDIREIVFPVGYVWLSTDPTSPAASFGGTWVTIEKPALLQLGEPSNEISAQDFKLQIKNLPKIGWLKNRRPNGYNQNGAYSVWTTTKDPYVSVESSLQTDGSLYWSFLLNGTQGTGNAYIIDYGTLPPKQQEFFPPCLEVFCWQRVG